MQIVQTLKPEEDEPDSYFPDVLTNGEVDENHLRRWIFSDDANFYEAGKANCQLQNVRIRKPTRHSINPKDG